MKMPNRMDKNLKGFIIIFHKLKRLIFDGKFLHKNNSEIQILQFLMHSKRHKNITTLPTNISHHLHISSARVAALLNILEQKKMILRTNINGDKRKTLILITKKGEQELHAKMKNFANNVIKIFNKLPKKDTEDFFRILNKLVNLIEQESKTKKSLCSK